jgi:CHASE3 domain sensor protein
MEFLLVLVSFFILYELIKTKNEVAELNEVVKDLKNILSSIEKRS